MKKNPIDSLWEHIEQDLSVEYKELHKENLYSAIHQLPTYQAPESCWMNIEASLSSTQKRFWLQPYFKIAAAVVILLGIGNLVQQKMSQQKHTYYATVYAPEVNLYNLADTASDSFDKIKNSACNLRPDFCQSDEFKQAETTYSELNEMQAQILQKSSMYDNDDELENMLLKIASRKKAIQQELIQQLNQS